MLRHSWGDRSAASQRMSAYSATRRTWTPVDGSLASMARRSDSSAAAAMRSALRRALSSRQATRVPAAAVTLAVAMVVRERGIANGGGKKRGILTDEQTKRPDRMHPVGAFH